MMHAALSSKLSQTRSIRAEVTAEQSRLLKKPLNTLPLPDVLSHSPLPRLACDGYRPRLPGNASLLGCRAIAGTDRGRGYRRLPVRHRITAPTLIRLDWCPGSETTRIVMAL